MSIFISHSSALAYWRRARRIESLGLGVLYDGTVLSSSIFEHVRARDCARQFKETVPLVRELDVEEYERLGFGVSPLEVLVPSRQARRRSEGLASHVFAGPLPQGAFCRVTRGTYVSSPEFTFLQMAGSLPFVDLVLLGYELCGSYAIPEDGKGEATSGCPGVRAASIGRLLSSAGGANHVADATRSLACVISGSNSPMESVTSAFLTLPTIDGGCNRKPPLLNHRIEDRPGHYYVIDLFWQEGPVAIEYEGSHHGDPERYRRDAKRSADLERLGIKVIALTRDQIRSEAAMEDIAKQVSTAIGQPWRAPSVAGAQRRRALLDELLAATRGV